MCIIALSAYMFVHHILAVLVKDRRVSDSLELELWAAVSHYMGAGNWT